MRLRYRIGQFWQALTAKRPVPAPPELEPGLQALFLRMAPADQAHGLRTVGALPAGRVSADLAAAALLHDLGKSGSEIHLGDRIAFVLAGRLARRWLQALPGRSGWPWRGLIALREHAGRGADLIAAAGGSQRVEQLVRHHHDDPTLLPWPAEERRILQALQEADESS